MIDYFKVDVGSVRLIPVSDWHLILLLSTLSRWFDQQPLECEAAQIPPMFR